jgi:hypothetical protein
MIEIALNEPPPGAWITGRWQAEAGVRPASGGLISPDSPLGEIHLGRPEIVPMFPEMIDGEPELAKLLRLRLEQAQFHLVHLVCSFRPVENEPFTKAWLRVRLSAQPGVQEYPVAWCMLPTRVDVQNGETTQSQKLGATLTLLRIAELKLESETQTKGSQRRASLLAFNERGSDPYWEFTGFEEAPLEGTYRLALVVEAEKGAVVDGGVELRAEIRRQILGVIRYRAAFGDGKGVMFQLRRPVTG